MRTGKSGFGRAGLVLASGLLLAVGSGGTAVADTADEFFKLYQAVKAQELCKNGGRDYSRATQMKLAKAIDSAIGHDIDTGKRLSLVVEAKLSVRRIYNVKTCADPRMQDLLSLFTSKLGSAL